MKRIISTLTIMLLIASSFMPANIVAETGVTERNKVTVSEPRELTTDEIKSNTDYTIKGAGQITLPADVVFVNSTFTRTEESILPLFNMPAAGTVTFTGSTINMSGTSEGAIAINTVTAGSTVSLSNSTINMNTGINAIAINTVAAGNKVNLNNSIINIKGINSKGINIGAATSHVSIKDSNINLKDGGSALNLVAATATVEIENSTLEGGQAINVEAGALSILIVGSKLVGTDKLNEGTDLGVINSLSTAITQLTLKNTRIIAKQYGLAKVHGVQYVAVPTTFNIEEGVSIEMNIIETPGVNIGLAYPEGLDKNIANSIAVYKIIMKISKYADETTVTASSASAYTVVIQPNANFGVLKKNEISEIDFEVKIEDATIETGSLIKVRNITDTEEKGMFMESKQGIIKNKLFYNLVNVDNKKIEDFNFYATDLLATGTKSIKTKLVADTSNLTLSGDYEGIMNFEVFYLNPTE